ncbi:MAG: dUTP diphosphatase [Clostridium chrysemydis]|uniref:dUTP diphosphatase n=1 Tax=Clostridium chrysemydis TaxID=2665504 RepID=UPI003F2D6A83
MKDLTIKIKMVDKNLTKIGGDIPGEWYDLRASSIKQLNGADIKISKDLFKSGFKYKEGDVLFLGLGLAIEPPKGYEIIIAPRSSTFKNYGFTLTNSIGIGDNTFRGEYCAMVYCTRDGEINYDDRFLQFRIQKQQPKATIEFVDELSETDRGEGGYGSTGVK